MSEIFETIQIMRKNLGPVTAYKYAVQQGYTGTEQEFSALMASYATVAEEAEAAKDDAVDAKTAAEEAQAAAEAAAEQAEGAIEVDDTLSVEGRAADAAITGSKINGVKQELSSINIKRFKKTTLQSVDISNYLQSGIMVNLSGNPYNTINFTPMSAYKYYDIPAEIFSEITVSAYSGTSIKAVIFTNENDALIDYYPKENIPSPGQIVNVECAVPSEATRILLCGRTADNVDLSIPFISFEMNDELAASISAADSFSDMSIENYSRKMESVGTFYENAYCDASGNNVSLSGYTYKTLTGVIPGKKILLSGVGGTGNRFYVTQDENNNVIDVYPSSRPIVHFTDYEYVIPSGAVKVTVNGTTAEIPDIKKESVNKFVLDVGSSSSIAAEISKSVYSIGTEAIKYTVSLHGSKNGLFNFQTLTNNESIAKNVADDICPVSLVSDGYIGANHGYLWVYKCVANEHGLSESDIGKTYTNGTDTWVLIQVLDSNTIVVGCYDSSVWYKLKKNPPSTLDFGTEITVTPTLAQLYPSVKNGTVRVLENNSKKFSVLETYDIIDLGTGIDAIIENTGDNDNESVAELADPLITVRNIYDFYNNGSVVIHQNLKALKTVKLNFYGGVQSGAFGANDGYAIPQTSLKPITQTDGTSVSFDRTTWDSESVPPSLFIQTNNVGNNMTSIMLLGYIAENRNVSIASTAGVSQGSSRKMYPYLISPSANIDPGTVYNSISYRVPIFDITSADKVLSNYTFILDDVYMFVITREAVNTSVNVPDEAFGKKVTVIISDGVSISTKDVIDSIDIVSDGEGYLLVKLSV